MTNGVYVKRPDTSESKTDLTASQSDIRFQPQQKTCTSTVKILSFFLFVALAVAVAACVALAYFLIEKDRMSMADVTTPSTTSHMTKPVTTTTSIPGDPSVCMSPECAVAAARIYQSLDMNVHPCDNFYEYACGGWMKKHPIPEDRSSVSRFSVLNEELSVIVKGLIEKNTEPGELPAVTKAKNLYRSCMNEELVEYRGLEPMEFVFKEMGEWPLLNSSWSSASFDLMDTLLRIKKYGSSPLIYQGVSTDLKNSSVRILTLDQPGLILGGRDFYISKANDSIPALRKYMISLAEAFGADDMNQAEQDVNDVIDFETKIANLITPDEERRDLQALYQKFTLKDLPINISDKFDWFRYHYEIMSQPGVAINITDEEPVIVYAPTVLRDLLDLVELTPARTLQNYLIATEMLTFISYLPQKFRDIRTEFNKVMYGAQTEPARWKLCVSTTTDSLENVVGRLFVDEEYDEDAKSIASVMISTIRSAFNELLDELDWMDEPTKKVAMEKAAAMQEKIGYSEEDLKNDTKLNQKYKDVTYDPEKYLENALFRFRYEAAEYLKKLREPVDKNAWFGHPVVVNAFYSATTNGISFPAGILQPPFFSKHYPKSMNYGGIGLVIGHEITHGFDDQGRLFNKNGDLAEWWSNDVVEQFKAKAQCMVEQYGNYTVTEVDMKVNGRNTQGENIADNGGLIQAYTAYREWVKQQGKEEPKLPGLHFNNNQLFFVNMAQVWCEVVKPQGMVSRILTGVHSPKEFRVIGPLQNSEEFAEAFNCPKTSFMNPEKKCRVW